MLGYLSNTHLTTLDGGFATELEALGHSLKDNLWSARLLRDDPNSVAKVHYNFLYAIY